MVSSEHSNTRNLMVVGNQLEEIDLPKYYIPMQPNQIVQASSYCSKETHRRKLYKKEPIKGK